MGTKFTYESIKEYIEKEGCKLLSEEYINTHTKLKIQCPEGHIFEMSFNNFKKGQRCKQCQSKNKYSIKQIRKIANSNSYDLLNEENKINMRTVLELRKENNIVEMTLYTFESKFIKREEKRSR